MNCKWIRKTNSDKLIIFFNGWGMDETIVSHLGCDDFDVIVFFDYRDFNIDIDLSKYKEKHLIAWSMGVMVATLFDFGKLNSAIAICGTPFSIDDRYGIPKKIYSLTINGFNENSVNKFMGRMFLDTPNIDKFSNRTLESQKEELIKLSNVKPKPFNYTKSIVADSDKIIPTKNQLNYWKNPIIIKSGHCPFMLYNKWTEIINL